MEFKSKINNGNFRNILILIMLSYFFLMFGNGILDLTDNDEVFYSLTAKEMIAHRTWTVPYLFNEPQFEKPVLTYALIKLAFQVFGESSFWARFFPSLFGIIGIIAVYLLSLIAFGDRQKAFLSALILLTSVLYIGLSRTVFTDMIFSVLILLALLSFFWGYRYKNRRSIGVVLFFIFSALAVLTKGPLGIVMPVACATLYLILRNDLGFLFHRSFVAGIIIFSALALPWYIEMWRLYGKFFMDEFFYNCHIRRIFEAEHPSNNKWYFYPLSAVGCMFPWSLVTLSGLVLLIKEIRQKEHLDANLFLAVWIISVFLIFQFAASKLVSYIFPFFPALAIISGNFLGNILEKKNFLRQVLPVSALVIVMALAILPFVIFIALKIYPIEIPGIWRLYVSIAVLLFFGWLILRQVIKKNDRAIIHLIVAFAALALVNVFMFGKNANPYASSRGISEALLKEEKLDSKVLCSKFFVRGVRYYTGKDMAVMDSSKKFFSPHPIPMLYTAEMVEDFLRSQGRTYCILKDSALEDIKRTSNGKFNLREIIRVGNKNLVEVVNN